MKNFSGPYRSYFFSIIYLILLLLAAPAKGQDNASYPQKTLTSAEINDLVDLAKYNRTVKKLKSKKRTASDKKKEGSKKVQEEDEVDFDSPNSNFTFGGGPLVKGILYLIIAALVVFLIVAIFSSIKVDKKIKDKEIAKEKAARLELQTRYEKNLQQQAGLRDRF